MSPHSNFDLFLCDAHMNGVCVLLRRASWVHRVFWESLQEKSAIYWEKGGKFRSITMNCMYVLVGGLIWQEVAELRGGLNQAVSSLDCDFAKFILVFTSVKSANANSASLNQIIILDVSPLGYLYMTGEFCGTSVYQMASCPMVSLQVHLKGKLHLSSVTNDHHSYYSG